MAFKSVAVEVVTANTAKQFFTTTTLASWAHVLPHTSNTGLIRLGDTNTQVGVIATGGAGVPVALGTNDYVDLQELYVNSSGVSNYGVLLYIERA